MLIEHETKKLLIEFSGRLGLKASQTYGKADKSRKIEQILAYLEAIHSQLRKYSFRRELVLVESGAGNCYLSFILYYFYSEVIKRPIQIHCIDINEKLMDKNRRIAEELGFEKMFFHAADIEQYIHEGKIDAACSLHACDTATDKAIALGLRNNARHIFSVSCCQHSLKGRMQASKVTEGITKHSVLKERLMYSILDSMRALLMEMFSYDVSVVEFCSSRATDKNLMLRAHKRQLGSLELVRSQYRRLKQAYSLSPYLETRLSDMGLLPLLDE